MKMKSRVHHSRATLALLFSLGLVACNSSEAPLAIHEPSAEELAVAAANAHPCSEEFVFQSELNGAPDDTYTGSYEAQGIAVTKEEHWYADTSTIVFFTYAEGDNWCNVWNENGVGWGR